MAAVQVTTAGVALLAAKAEEERDVIIQNLGPNAIFIEIGAAATLIGGLQIAATTGQLATRVPANAAVNAIAATANQASPADTRIVIT
jgi:hypothetical protein